MSQTFTGVTMTPEMTQLYEAAVAAERSWWEALEEEFHSNAASARYDERGVSTSRLKELRQNFEAATTLWLAASRKHREAQIMHPGDGVPVPDRIILSARITPLPINILDPMPEVWVTFNDGEEKLLFSYYPDEISFLESEFVGLTEKQARQLRHQRDVNYLRS